MGVAEVANVVNDLAGWALGVFGLLTLMAGSGLFAYATWRTGTHSPVGTILLGLTAIAAVPATLFFLGLAPWEPLAPIVTLAMLALFAAGWVLTGIGAVRADRSAVLGARGAV